MSAISLCMGCCQVVFDGAPLTPPRGVVKSTPGNHQLFLANQGMSRRQCNSKCSANNRCHLTVQEQISRVPASIYHIHDFNAMP